MSERGYSLVEVAIAVTVLAVGVLAVAATGAPLARLVRWGGAQSLSATVAGAQLELLRAQCATAASGEASGGGRRMRWTVASAGPLRTVTVVITYPWGALPRSDRYQTVLSCAP